MQNSEQYLFFVLKHKSWLERSSLFLHQYYNYESRIERLTSYTEFQLYVVHCTSLEDDGFSQVLHSFLKGKSCSINTVFSSLIIQE